MVVHSKPDLLAISSLSEVTSLSGLHTDLHAQETAISLQEGTDSAVASLHSNATQSPLYWVTA